MIGFLGLCVDAGRLYIARNESQAYADSVALSAAMHLDETPAGIAAAKEAVATNGNRWNFGTSQFSGTVTEFAKSADGPWIENPEQTAGLSVVRVRTTLSAGLIFVPAFIGRTMQTVNASAVAGRTAQTGLAQSGFPFSPLAINAAEPAFGMVAGTNYTIRYDAAGKACDGDLASAAHLRNGPLHTAWGDASPGILSRRIVEGYQSPGDSLSIGKPLPGTAQPDEDITALQARIGQDGDSTSTTYAAYKANSTHNDRRVVTMPIQDEESTAVLGFGDFLLLPVTKGAPWCAAYIGAGAGQVRLLR